MQDTRITIRLEKNLVDKIDDFIKENPSQINAHGNIQKVNRSMVVRRSLWQFLSDNNFI